MVEKVKKEKTPAKPRTTKAAVKKTVATKVADTAPPAAKTPSPIAKAPIPAARKPAHEDIARLAYQFWIERGRKNGRHEEDWLRAEHELKTS